MKDAAGNRLTEAGEAYTIGAGNQVTAAKGEGYTYDDLGNTTRAGEWIYTWNDAGELIRAQGPTADVSFKYDATGRRIQKAAAGGATRDYLYDAEDIAVEYIDGVPTFYLHGPGIDEPLAMLRGGQAYFFHADGLGSITRITDTTGVVVKSLTYSSFGKVVSETGSLDQPYGFTGRERDTETGLNYHRARYYDPEVGRWLSRDALGFGGGDVVLYGYVDSVGKPIQFSANLYHYTFNNPLNLKDPSGLDPYGRDGRINPVTQCHVQPTKKELADLGVMAALVGITGVFGEDLVLYTLMNPQKALDFVQSALPHSTPEPNGTGFIGSIFGSKFQYYLENRR